MGRVIYSLNVSLDGYVETPEHSLDWADVDEELHTWFNDRTRETDVFFYGRRMYELMAAFWPTVGSDPAAPDYVVDFAEIWNQKPKVVFSSTLTSVQWNSRLAGASVAEELARAKAEFEGDIDVGGPNLASAFIRQGLVDDYRLLVHPVVLGAGTPFFPSLQSHITLRLAETRTFASGVVYLGYRAG